MGSESAQKGRPPQSGVLDLESFVMPLLRIDSFISGLLFSHGRPSQKFAEILLLVDLLIQFSNVIVIFHIVTQ